MTGAFHLCQRKSVVRICLGSHENQALREGFHGTVIAECCMMKSSFLNYSSFIINTRLTIENHETRRLYSCLIPVTNNHQRISMAPDVDTS